MQETPYDYVERRRVMHRTLSYYVAIYVTTTPATATNQIFNFRTTGASIWCTTSGNDLIYRLL